MLRRTIGMQLGTLAFRGPTALHKEAFGHWMQHIMTACAVGTTVAVFSVAVLAWYAVARVALFLYLFWYYTP